MKFCNCRSLLVAWLFVGWVGLVGCLGPETEEGAASAAAEQNSQPQDNANKTVDGGSSVVDTEFRDDGTIASETTYTDSSKSNRVSMIRYRDDETREYEVAYYPPSVSVSNLKKAEVYYQPNGLTKTREVVFAPPRAATTSKQVAWHSSTFHYQADGTTKSKDELRSLELMEQDVFVSGITNYNADGLSVKDEYNADFLRQKAYSTIYKANGDTNFTMEYNLDTNQIDSNDLVSRVEHLFTKYYDNTHKAIELYYRNDGQYDRFAWDSAPSPDTYTYEAGETPDEDEYWTYYNYLPAVSKMVGYRAPSEGGTRWFETVYYDRALKLHNILFDEDGLTRLSIITYAIEDTGDIPQGHKISKRFYDPTDQTRFLRTILYDRDALVASDDNPSLGMPTDPDYRYHHRDLRDIDLDF